MVMSERKVVGIITERDLVARLLTKSGAASGIKVRDAMSSPLVVVSPEATVEEAARIMAQNRVRRLPVVADKGLVGLVTVTDIAKALAEQKDYCDSIFNAMARVIPSSEKLYQ